MRPTPGYTLITEDTVDTRGEGLKDMGFEVNEKSAGVTGTVLASSHTEGYLRHLFNLLFSNHVQASFRKGQRVVFSKFIAEHLDVEGYERLRSVPTEAILATY